MIPTQDITGLILAGGRGSRMGGVDKGLQLLHGTPLVEHVLRRLTPQVGSVLINANRNLDAYRALGTPVCSDHLGDYPGPLAGFAAGLAHCATPYLVTVPCDTPDFPEDMVSRLARALSATQSAIAFVRTNEQGYARAQPVFSLLKVELLPHLLKHLTRGHYKVQTWLDLHPHIAVEFPDALAFRGANTLDELRQLASSTSTLYANSVGSNAGKSSGVRVSFSSNNATPSSSTSRLADKSSSAR